MSDQRTHHVTTTDGVIIGGTVHGQGPPLVFVQGIIGDGDLDWRRLLGHLTGRFTCHLPSWRCRGLSGEHSDLSFGRLVDDVLAYVDSIEAPTRVVGWSSGADLALAIAGAPPSSVDAVVLVEPVMPRLFDEEDRAVVGDAVARMAELAAEGAFTAAARAFARFPFTDEDIAAAEEAGYFEAAGRYVPNVLNLLQQHIAGKGSTVDDPAVLGSISAPVLVLHGSDTKHYAAVAARQVIDHVADARMQEILGAGHAAPLTHPEALARALTEFFERAQQRA